MTYPTPRTLLVLFAISAALAHSSAQIVTSNPSGEKNILQVSNDQTAHPLSISVINNQNTTFYPESLSQLEKALKKPEPEAPVANQSKELSFGTANQTVQTVKDAFKMENHSDIQIKPEAEPKITLPANAESP